MTIVWTLYQYEYTYNLLNTASFNRLPGRISSNLLCIVTYAGWNNFIFILPFKVSLVDELYER